MLIKYIDHNDDTHIIENVKNIIAHSKSLDDEELKDIGVINFYELEKNEAPHPSYKVITFFNEEDIYSSLRVYGTAYICNNDGKTIHKVSFLD